MLAVARGRARNAPLYEIQVARAKRYVQAHLEEELTLGDVAAAAGTSPFHFSRIFHALTGETIFHYRTRWRVRAAARRLHRDPQGTVAITAIALEVGFQTASSLNKAFRAAVGTTPRDFRALAPAERRAILAKLEYQPTGAKATRLDLSPRPRIVELPDRWVAFARELGPYSESAPLAWQRLERAMSVGPSAIRLGAAHDDPWRHDDARLRYDAAVVIDEGAPLPAGVRRALWRGGPYAVFRFRGPYRRIAEAFFHVFGGWCAKHHARFRDAPCLEIYPPSGPCMREEELSTDLCVPIAIEDPS